MRMDQVRFEAQQGLLALLMAIACFSIRLQSIAQSADDFNPGANGVVYVLAPQQDGKFLIGGIFTSVGGLTRNRIARVTQDGTLDAGFVPKADNGVNALVVQPDGAILVAGDFRFLNGEAHNRLGRLNPDGTVDSNFKPNVDGTVWALALQRDGKILIGGIFSSVNLKPRLCLARLNADGSLDSSFNPGAGDSGRGVFCLTIQANGQILAGGDFTILAGQPRSRLGRLNTDGTLDESFPAEALAGAVNCFAEQPDGRIVVGGEFSALGGVSRSCIGRLNADGTIDTNFVGSATSTVTSVVLQADGKLFVGGLFSRISLHSAYGLARLNGDGTFDTTFNPDTRSGSQVYAVALSNDGRVVAGGGFTWIGGQSRQRIARLTNPTPPIDNLAFEGSNVFWLRGGSSPEVSSVTFYCSTNKTEWTDLGLATRVPGGWQLTGLTLPPEGTIRARATLHGGLHNNSSSFYELLAGPSKPPALPTILVGENSFGLQNGYFGFSMSGQSGATVVVEGSTNLLDWTGLATNVFGTEPQYFYDFGSTNFSCRFYRLRGEIAP